MADNLNPFHVPFTAKIAKCKPEKLMDIWIEVNYCQLCFQSLKYSLDRAVCPWNGFQISSIFQWCMLSIGKNLMRGKTYSHTFHTSLQIKCRPLVISELLFCQRNLSKEAPFLSFCVSFRTAQRYKKFVQWWMLIRANSLRSSFRLNRNAHFAM